jgi:hypothetical protein
VLAADLTNPQSLNRYAYVGNDPINFVDPTGMLMALVCWDVTSYGWGPEGSITYSSTVCAIIDFGGGGIGGGPIGPMGPPDPTGGGGAGGNGGNSGSTTGVQTGDETPSQKQEREEKLKECRKQVGDKYYQEYLDKQKARNNDIAQARKDMNPFTWDNFGEEVTAASIGAAVGATLAKQALKGALGGGALGVAYGFLGKPAYHGLKQVYYGLRFDSYRHSVYQPKIREGYAECEKKYGSYDAFGNFH